MKRPVLTLIAALVGLVAPLLVMAPATASTTCSSPKYVTTDPNGMWSNGGYIVANDMWNSSGYKVTQKLSACSYRNWHVSATADNSSGDGAVKTYPNVHKDFINWNTGAQPALRSFKKISSTFAATTPGVGIYDASYDIWLNSLNREVMIWTYNRGQSPAGTRVAKDVSLSGHTWNVYATSGNGYLAFVPTRRFARGTVHVKSMLNWLTAHKRVPTTAKLSQICYGFEVVSTGGTPKTFKLSDFSVSTAKR